MFVCVFVSVLAFVFVCGCVCDYTVPDPLVCVFMCVLCDYECAGVCVYMCAL